MSFTRPINILAFLLVLTALPSFGQQKIYKVHYEFWKRPWLDKQSHDLWDHTITMEFGEKYSTNRHSNLRQTTGLGYQDLQMTIDSLRQQAEDEAWSDDSLETKINWYKENAPGGRLFIFIARYQEEQANTRYMYIQVRDFQNESMILRQDIGYNAPELPEGYGWWNFVEVPLRTEPPPAFIVFLKKTTDVSPIAGFRIEPNE